MGRYALQTTGVLAGLHEDQNPHALRDNELVLANNAARHGQTLGHRPGLVRPGSGEDYENALTDAEDIQGIFEYRQNFDEGRKLIAISESNDAAKKSSAGGGVYTDDATELDLTAGTGNNVQVTNAQDNVWTFAEHQNRLWAAGGAATDDLWYWDGSAAPSPLALLDSGGVNRVRPKFVKQFGGYLLISGLRGGTIADNNPLVTRYPFFASDPTSLLNWQPGNTIGFDSTKLGGVGEFGSDFSTGFGQYQDNNGKWLLLLGNRDIAACQLDRADDFRVTDAISNGCVHQRAFVNLGLDSGDAVFISDKGIHSLRQSQEHGILQSQFLSWKIRDTFATLRRARLQFSVGAYDFVNGRVVFAVTTGGNAAHDLLLCLDVKEQETLTADNALWYIWRIQGATINELKMARDATDEWHLYAGTTTGDVVRFDEEVFSDLGSAYPMQIQTKHRDHGSTAVRKQMGDIWITLEGGGSYTPRYQTIFDMGRRSGQVVDMPVTFSSGSTVGTTTLVGTATVGTASSVVAKKLYGRGNGYTISHFINHGGTNEFIGISKIDYQLAVLGEAEGAEA